MVMEELQEDMGEGNMQCTNHPYKNSNPGGICAFCLQEKLGKLVSSSFPIAIFPTSSSSSSPSFRSDFGNGNTSTINQNGSNNDCHYHSRRARIPFLLTQKKKKKKNDAMMPTVADHASLVFRRSKSTATPRRRGGVHFLDADDGGAQKRGFWSFLYLSKHSNPRKNVCYGSAFAASTGSKKKEEFESESPNEASFDRKVSRSRSVGCGSRSFSGDFFERISTGFGDCTLRRVESQREGKAKVTAVHGGGNGGGGQDFIKERVKCGGIFSGFMITSSSSSSSSSYWVSSSSTEDHMNGKAVLAPAPVAAAAGHLAHGRSKSWGWAFASPIRAFSKPSSGKREASTKNTSPNLSAIPSLLAVRGQVERSTSRVQTSQVKPKIKVGSSENEA